MAKAVERFISDPACWSLYLWGETGSRKTAFACTLLRHMRGSRPDKWGEFVPTYKVVQALRNLDSDKAVAQIGEWRTSPCLVMDDLGKHRDTPHIIEQLLFILHYRYDWADGTKKTIVTANMDLNELAKRIDPATARRLEEGLVVEMATERKAKDA